MVDTSNSVETSEQTSEEPVGSTTEVSKPQAEVSEKRNPSLKEWANTVIASNNEDKGEATATINLSRFGLQNPQDVVTFLNSPAGETISAEIGAELAKAEASQAQQEFYQQQHELLMHRLRAILLLWYIDKEAHAAEEIKELTKELNDKLHKTDEKSKTVKTSSASDLAEIHQYFDKAIERLTEKEKENTATIEALTKSLKQLEEQGERIELRYKQYIAGLDEQESQVNFSDRDQIQPQITALTEKIDAMASEVGDCLGRGDEAGARTILDTLKALNLQIGVLRDVQAVLDNKKYYVNAEGKEVKSFKEAHFILKKGSQRIVKDNGKLYLLKPGQEWDEVKKDDKAKENARIDYEVLKQGLMSVKNLVSYQQGYERDRHSEETSYTTTQLAIAKEEGRHIQNHLNLVNAARASAIATAEKMNLSPRPIPSPTPTAGSSQTQKSSQASATMSYYKDQLARLRELKNITPEQLMDFVEHAPDRKEAVEYLRREFEGSSRRATIPQQSMQSVLKYLESYGVNTTKPSVTSIKSPLREEKPFEEHKGTKSSIEEDKGTAPTPFKTEPN